MAQSGPLPANPAQVPKGETSSSQSISWTVLPVELKELIIQHIIEMELPIARKTAQARIAGTWMTQNVDVMKSTYQWEDVFNFLCVATEMQHEGQKIAEALKATYVKRMAALSAAGHEGAGEIMLDALSLEDLAQQFSQTRWEEAMIHYSVYDEGLKMWTMKLSSGQAVRPVGNRVVFSSV